jgi:nitrite reductase (NADH) large subunit
VRHLIIGNGVAGTTAAAQIRKSDAGAFIRIITEEPFPFYSRIRLPEVLAGETDEKGLFIRKPDWYETNRIELSLSTCATAVDPDAKTVTTASGEKISYDRLLLSTGATCFVPPIPGAGIEGVFTLRTLGDAVSIRDFAARLRKHVALIGGGVLGLEAAYGLMRAGCSITVIEVLPRLLPRQMDPEGATLLQRRLESMGFVFHIGTAPAAIAGSGHVETVMLADNRRIDCGAVIISAGIRMNLSLPKELGMTTDRGLLVNDRMETGIRDIYAAGDLIQHNGQCYGIWPAAEKQGEIAGINMAGGSAEYRGTTMSNSLTVAGIDIFSAGDIDAEGKKESAVAADKEKFTYKKLVFNQNVISGAILLGDTRDRRKITKAISEKTDISGIRPALIRGDLSAL